MKNYIIYFFYLACSVWILIGISYGFRSTINYFDTHGAYNSGYEDYLNELFGYFYYIFIPYLFIFLSTFFLFKKNIFFIKWISILISIVFLYESFKLAYKNYYYNYVNGYEINSFVELIREYGLIVNLFYIFPLILAVLYACFIAWLYFKFRSKKD